MPNCPEGLFEQGVGRGLEQGLGLGIEKVVLWLDEFERCRKVWGSR